MNNLILPLMMMGLAVVLSAQAVKKELREIKHMVNEVVCEALETEETWAE